MIELWKDLPQNNYYKESNLKKYKFVILFSKYYHLVTSLFPLERNCSGQEIKDLDKKYRLAQNT